MGGNAGLPDDTLKRSLRRTGDVRLPLRPVEHAEHRQQVTFSPTDLADTMNVENPPRHYRRSREAIDCLVISQSLAYLTKVYMLANTQTMRPGTPSRKPCLRR